MGNTLELKMILPLQTRLMVFTFHPGQSVSYLRKVKYVLHLEVFPYQQLIELLRFHPSIAVLQLKFCLSNLLFK